MQVNLNHKCIFTNFPSHSIYFFILAKSSGKIEGFLSIELATISKHEKKNDDIVSAAPRLDLPENYNDGLIFRYDEVIRLKIPLIAKPPPRVTW
jgi:hypothetical protein